MRREVKLEEIVEEIIIIKLPWEMKYSNPGSAESPL